MPYEEISPKEWLEFLVECADAADNLCRHYFNKTRLKVDQKKNKTPVTEADLAIEKEIRRLSAKLYPKMQIYAEEFGQCPDDAPLKLIIDPIDGTQNFVRGISIVGTLLAIEVNGTIVAGLVSAAITQERWWAARGDGAFYSNAFTDEPRQIHVSEIKCLGDAQAFYGSLFGNEASKSGSEKLIPLLSKTKRQRGFGDYAPHVYVAQGLGEFAVDFNLKPWDIAPLKIIVEEAGGICTSVCGKDSIYEGTIVSANPNIYDAVINYL